MAQDETALDQKNQDLDGVLDQDLQTDQLVDSLKDNGGTSSDEASDQKINPSEKKTVNFVLDDSSSSIEFEGDNPPPKKTFWGSAKPQEGFLKSTKPEKEINFSFNSFLVLLVCIFQFFAIGFLVLSNLQLKSRLEVVKTAFVDKKKLTFAMLPKGIQDLYMLKKDTTLLDELILRDTFQSENALLYAQKKFFYQNGQKLTQVSEFECSDTELGAFEASYECDVRLEKFAKRFGPTIIYEVEALVQGRDLIDLGRVVTLMEQKDYDAFYLNSDIINYFTRYMRDGIAQNRRQEGIKKIINALGDQAQIIISPYQQFNGKKSGFIVRAYRQL